MSLKSKEFLAMRNKAMVERKDRYEKRQHEQIDTLAKIAAKLKETPMVRGNRVSYLTIEFVVRKGRTFALLNNHASKKRKLNGAAANNNKESYEAYIADLEL